MEKMSSAGSPCPFERRMGARKVIAMSELPPLRDFPLFASLDEATLHLDTLVCFEGAGKWELEIQEERDLLAEARTQKASAA